MNSNKLLDNEDLFMHCGEIINKNVAAIQNQISSLRKHVGEQKRKIVKEMKSKGPDEDIATLEAVRKLHESVLQEYVELEQQCEECLLRIKTSLSVEAKHRLQPESYTSLPEIRKAFEALRSSLVQLDQKKEHCQCAWSNVPDWLLDETREILNRPKTTAPTEFDESDLKFQQDVIALRTAMFSLHRRGIESSNGDGSAEQYSTKEDASKAEKPEALAGNELDQRWPIKLRSLKFIDGEFSNDPWIKILDARGKQLRSKWHFVLHPQITKIVSKRRIPELHLDPQKTLDFLENIKENGINFTLTKEDLMNLVEFKSERMWLRTWRPQLRTVDGDDVAAALIQAYWRGYWIRKRMWESKRFYIAASVLWFAWISVLRKREMRQRYQEKFVTLRQVIREKSWKLSRDFPGFIKMPHVVVHLTSFGYPGEIRRSLNPKVFAIHQNTLSLRMSFVRNPKTEVVYVLAVKPTEDLLTMYSDTVESVSPDADGANRITFIALSQRDNFQHRGFNLSRILHCSEDSQKEIKKKIQGKPAYILPLILDECDVILAGNLGIPLLSPHIQLQQELSNLSKIKAIITDLGILQPPYAQGIRDYATLCSRLAELIVVNTEICSWLIRLNCGMRDKHSGTFLINHMSVPFMPILRRESEKCGDDWKVSPNLHKEFLKSLMDQLPKVVRSVTKLSSAFHSWKEFSDYIQKFGCIVQAVPVEKNSSVIAVALFVPGKATGRKPKWLGTADKMALECNPSTRLYMIPESSINVSKLAPVVNKFAEAMQSNGYFGYLTLDLYCYPHKFEDRLMVLLSTVHPFYTHLQTYIDWLKFAIGGHYDGGSNKFNADIVVTPEIRKEASYLLSEKLPKWNETRERVALAISQLHHTRFAFHQWSKLKMILEHCGIQYDANMKQGSHLILHDGKVKEFGLMITIGSSMMTTLSTAQNCLKKLHRTLVTKSNLKADTNVRDIADYLRKLSQSYVNVLSDQCP